MKKILLAALGLLFVLPVLAVESGALLLDTGWKMVLSDSSSFSIPSFEGADAVDWPIQVSSSESGGREWAWFATRFQMPKPSGSQLLTLYVGNAPGVVHVYLNGVLAGSYGKEPPSFFVHNTTPVYFTMPAALLRDDGQENELVIRLYNNGAAFIIYTVELGAPEVFERVITRKELINNHLYLAFAIATAIIGLFYFLQFLFDRTEWFKLYFSLSCFFLGVYFFDIGAMHDLLPVFPRMVFGKMCLPLFYGALTLFFIEFFSIHRVKIFQYIVAGTAVLLALPFPLFARTTSDLEIIFGKIMLPTEFFLLFIIYLTFRALFAKNVYAVPIAAGVVFAVALGTLDIMAVIQGIMPDVWWQGTGMFGFNVSLFVAMALREMFFQRHLSRLIDENQGKSRRLADLFENIRRLSVSVKEISDDLNRSIGETASSVESMSSGVQVINGSVEGQFQSVERTNRTVSQMISASGGMYEKIDGQFSSIRTISAAMEQMLENSERVIATLRDTLDYSRNLTSVTEKGDAAIRESARAIEMVKETSKLIYGVVDTVNEIAERTNLLAMNAAIEASHAGAFGKGFAVVAQEIKKLSEGSSRNVASIKSHMDSINGSIDAEISVNAHLHQVLAEIQQSAQATAAKIDQLYTATIEQQSASSEVQKSLSEIRSSSELIKEDSDRQGQQGREVLTQLQALVGTSEQVRSRSESIAGSVAVISSTMEKLRSLSERSNSEFGNLAGILEKEGTQG